MTDPCAIPPAADAERLPDGALRVWCDSACELRLMPDGHDGWTAEDVGDLAGATLVRGEERRGFVLRDGGAEGAEIARTTPLPGTGRGGTFCSLLTGDGRLFVIRPASLLPPRLELTSWEAPGAYLTAVPRSAPGGWRIAPSPAAAGLQDIRALTVLLAAELLLAEEPDGR